jgi:hypothetical protein
VRALTPGGHPAGGRSPAGRHPTGLICASTIHRQKQRASRRRC